ncbi:MAG TPA: serine/threonine-protein kinase, partial [Polyangiaceae bacterium]|nr:serine/threonine-protein kinase [Polyangiaceae bacterium]
MKAISDAHGRLPLSFRSGPEAPAEAADVRPQTPAPVASSPPEARAFASTSRPQALTSARYRPLLELGRGGMSRVYVAESLRSEVQKLVVLKVLNPEFAVDPEMRAAFRREAELSACLNHPNIVQVFEVSEQAGRPVIVMQYLDGVPLSEVLHRSARELPLVLHLQVLAHLLSGLHYFHELRDGDDVALTCVHRAVAPQNVLVLHEGGVKVLDFGIAKIHTLTQPQTRVGIVKGKIRYMPAEQLLGTTG